MNLFTLVFLEHSLTTIFSVSLWLWQISVEDERDRQNRLAKMRSLLFSHEIKAKRIKKIKSKTFHRQLKKSRLKSTSSEVQMDPEAANEYAKKQEFKRAKVTDTCILPPLLLFVLSVIMLCK